jgi:hypothetical protein
MKKKLLFIFALVIGISAVHAQDKMDSKTDTKMEKMEGKKDCIMMQNGKMMVQKKGQTMEMMEDMTLKNGTMVMKDGSIKGKDGKMTKLGEGECIYMDGKMKKMAGKMNEKM